MGGWRDDGKMVEKAGFTDCIINLGQRKGTETFTMMGTDIKEGKMFDAKVSLSGKVGSRESRSKDKVVMDGD
ncbi:hypothetical protein H6P81_007617 [Aristolochia fimbriata]|uniref:Uncharacterized protein n=1 Tax=Aristolochia fimbriata TaxID=158543 RepID=A0AAV7F596_ARIFI|nr:hypothetical protein H6P81_007617 [Aristolochia fimbriata]